MRRKLFLQKTEILKQSAVTSILFILVLFSFVSSISHAAPDRINFQANIRKPDGSRLEANDVSFRLKYLNAAASCTVYVEDYLNYSMVGSGGNVSLLMGNGTKVFPVTATSLYSTFNNAVSNTMACAEGGTYSPTLATERRLITVEFFYTGSNGLQVISNIEINSVPYAMHSTNAEQLAGFAANLYTKFSDFTTCTGGQVLTYNGTAFSCVAAGGSSQWTTNGSDIHFSTGNVGIGINSPATSLDVNGTLHAGTTAATGFFVNSTDTTFNRNVTILNTGSGPRIHLTDNGDSLYIARGVGGDPSEIGTSNTSGNKDLVFSPGGTAAMTMMSTGDIGIGNLAPAYKLDVVGDVNVTGNFKVNGVNIATGGGTVTSVTATPPLLSSGGAAPDISLPVATAAVDGYLSATDFTTFNNKVSSQWTNNLTDIYFNTGKIGIGTTTPAAFLDVRTASATPVELARFMNTGASDQGYINIARPSDPTRGIVIGHQTAGSGNANYITALGTVSQSLAISSGKDGGGIDGFLALNPGAGLVGIGTTTPAYKLDVVGDVNVTGNFKINGTNISNTPSPWLMNVANTYFSTGNVGIGTSTPLEKLQVVDGNISMKTGGGAFQTPVLKWQGSDNSERFAVSGHTETVGGTADEWKFANLFGFTSFVNSNVETMRITADNKVGIGTTTPYSKLAVSGSGSSTFASSIAEFNGAIGDPATNIYGIGVGKTGTDHLLIGLNKNSATGSVPASSNFISTWQSNSELSLGRGGANGLPSTSDIFINGSGNVGMGSTTPAYKLDVAGDVNVTGNFKINGTNISNTSSPWLMNAADTYFNTGNVGIGTNTPGGLLDVTDGTYIRMAVMPTDSNMSDTYNMGIAPGDSKILFTSESHANRQAMIFSDTNGSETFFGLSSSADSGSTWLPRFVVKQTGNVGVGTSTPQATFDVAGNGQFSNGLYVNGTAVNGGSTSLILNNQNIANETYALSVGLPNVVETGFSINKLTGYSVGAAIQSISTNLFRILPNGNTGIGIGAPAYKLDVAGDVNVTGNFKINGTNITGSQWTTTGADIYNSNAGNVGIGTAGAPTAKLDVNGTIRMPALEFVAPTGDPAPTITSRVVPAGQGASTEKTELILFHSNDNTLGSGTDQITLRAPGLSFQTYDTNTVGSIADNAGYNERMYIMPNGNVGVNTVTPRAKFEVNGSVVQKEAIDNLTTTVDFGLGNLHYTTADCQAFDLHNLKDGGSYMFVVQGTNSATCSFTAFSDAGVTPLIVKLPPDHSATTNGKETIYNLVVMGSKVYFSWTPGY